MKHAATRTALALSLTLGLAAAPLAAAQPATFEEDIAPTPAALTDLLGPGGAQAAQCSFYLQMDLSDGGDGRSVMHWQTVVEDGHLVFTMSQSMGVDGHNTERQVYTTDGEFVESSSVYQSDSYKSTDTAVREGDKVRVTSSSMFDGNLNEPNIEVYDDETPADIIPTAWLPTAFAYHIRAGHDQFVIRMSDSVYGMDDYVQVFNCEDVGTETVEVGGAEHEAHVLMLTMSSEMAGEVGGGPEEGMVMQMYVLGDGSIVRMRAEFEGETMTAHAITAEEAQVLMESNAGDDGQDGAADDVVEDAAEDAG